MRFQVDARDIRKLDRALAAMQQPELRHTTSKALTAAANAVVVPAMREEIQSSVKGHSPKTRQAWHGTPKRGTKGPLDKSVRSKQLKKRAAFRDEMVAIGTGPRAWYKHLAIQPVRPHGLLRGASLRSGRLQDESRRAGRYHPGTQGNDLVTRTGRKVAPTVVQTVGKAVVDSFARQMKSRG